MPKHYFDICPHCKGRLDPGEKCDCKQSDIILHNSKTAKFEKITRETSSGQLELETEKLCCV